MVLLKNISEETLHFPHIGTIEPSGTIEASEADAEILLRNHSMKRADQNRVDASRMKGIERNRSMKGVERE